MDASHPGDHIHQVVMLGGGHRDWKVMRDARETGDVTRSCSEGNIL
jgi:hypothetical protein